MTCSKAHPGRLGLSPARLALIAAFAVCTSACEVGDMGAESSAGDDEPISSLVIRSEVRIGGDAARGPAALGAISTPRLFDGGARIAVPDVMSREIRVFSADGEYLETFGRRGEGPGEYEDLFSAFGLPGGGVVGWDFVRGIMTVHGASGDETIQLDLSAFSDRAPTLLGAFSDTTFAFRLDLSTANRWGRAQGPINDTVPFVRVDRRGAVIDTVAFVEKAEREYFEVGVGSVGVWGIERYIFADEPRAVIAGDELVVTSGRTVRYYPRSGPAREYEVDWQPHVPTADEVRAERDRRMSNNPYRRFQVRTGENIGELYSGVIERLPAVDTVPAFDDLAAGYDGSIWVRRFVMVEDTVSDWFLLDQRGRISATLRLPLDESLESGTRERVVVRTLDELHSPLLRVLELAPAK